ncbi:hypothetical protein BGZ95_002606 [Linnemannia exigua]|uniref:Uncharacterized protein n=1 Tax=Linnemannia exigua TaxID=604196 RepID=A0AAD4DIH1_9FUNG|nr:hypothetical protein BGZ95_002606 [Linnemannia exigua]
MMTEATEDGEVYTPPRIGKATEAMDATGQETERWDDAFEFDAHQSLDKIFELLHRHCPQSPLSDSSDQSDYFQARPPPTPPTVPSAMPLTHSPPVAEATKMSSLSPTSSASSSPRAITASVTAPSTIATSTRSLLSKYKSADNSGDKDSPALSTKSMTTITQEMMLSNLPAYTGIITRINPIKRVKAWVDDLEDLEVPEEDLNFNHVRSILAKSTSLPETLESVDSWDTGSERSITTSDRVGTITAAEGQLVSPVQQLGALHVLHHQSAGGLSPLLLAEDVIDVQQTGATASGENGETEKIETLDDAFEIPDDFGSFRLRMSPRLLNGPKTQETANHRQQLSLQQWRDSGSDFDELDFGTPLDSHSLSSSVSISRGSVIEDDDNLLDGIEFPADMEDLRLVPHRQYKDQDDFWDGLEVGDDDAFNHKGRTKHLVVRPIIAGRERSSSRVQREIVPLKDFVALPSRIPRLCRAPTDTSRPVTPASSLSRAHSTFFEFPLRHTPSKSSLPRLKRNSISRKEGARIEPGLHVSGPTMPSHEINSSSSPSTPPVAFPSKRNSALLNKDDLPSFKASSLAMRSVSFTEPEQPVNLAPATSTTLPSNDTTTITAKQSALTNTGRPFSSLRTLVRRWDLARPRFSIRGQIPAFDASSSASPESSAPQESQKDVLKTPIQQVSRMDDIDGDPRPLYQYQRELSHSRSSSITDWGSVVTSTETNKESRSPSRIGALSLGEISEGGSTTSDFGEMATTSPVAAGERFSRRWFLKRSPKQSILSDGSELDRIDNLPTFGSGDQQQQQLLLQQLQKQQPLDSNHLQAMQAAAAAQGRRQSLDRVSAWLRKPQSMVNLKDSPRPDVRRAESDVSTTKIQKTKSIRRSLFDIFGQSAAPIEEPKQAEQVEAEKEPSTKGKKLKKRKPFSGPTLIRDLSQTKVRKVSGMVFHPDSKMWNGNDHILNEFDDDDDIDYVNIKQQQHPPATTAVAVFDCPSPSTPYSQQFPFSSSSPISNAAIRPALISNMNQYSKQRTQVAGKMIFDPNRMCWIINPEYLTRKRQKRHGEQHHLHPRQVSLDDTWGDEPDVFAGMSDSDRDYDEDEVDEDTEEVHEGAITATAATLATAVAGVAGVAAVSVSANSSMERSKGRRLISRPSFRRVSSQDYLADEERLQAWAEPTRPSPFDASGGNHGADSRPNSMGVHSIVSKSSRRSLNMMGGCSNGLFVGGGYSSQGEFEVGVEFDITDEFLEQCMATESQHRKDAGKFFALPCTPTESASSAHRNRAPRRIPSKVLNKLMKSSISNAHGGKDKDKHRDNDKDKSKGKDKDSRNHGKVTESAALPPLPLDTKKKFILSPSAPLPLLSWPRRTKSKSVVLQAPILDCIGLPPPPEAQRIAAPKALAFQTEKKTHTSTPNKFKSLTLGRAGLFSSNPAPASVPTLTPFSRVPAGVKEKETAALPSEAQSTTILPRTRKSSRDMFFSQRLSSKKLHTPTPPERGSLTFAATFAIARKGNSAYDRRRISAHTFHPLTSSNPVLDGSGSGSANPEQWALQKDKRFLALDTDSGIESDDAAEDENDCERGYRKMPSSRGRPPSRTRSQLIMEFAQHSGPGCRF